MKTRVRYYVLSAAALLLACTSVLGSDYPTTVLSKNPLGYWRLDEAGPSPALHAVTNDSSLGAAGNGYIVLDVDMGQSGTNSVVGTAARLKNPGAAIGTGRTRIEVPWSAALNPNPPFSVEMWAKFNTIGSDSTGTSPLSSFSPYSYGGGSRQGWLFYVRGPDGRWQFRLGATSGYAAIISAGSGNAVVGTWQHVVATFDGTTARLYVNGVLVGSGPSAPWTPNPQMALRMGNNELGGSCSDGPFPIFNGPAGQGNTGNRGFDGWLDEVAVYPTVLSAGTVFAHYDAATTNNAGYHQQIKNDGPIGYWGLDDPPATAPAASSLPIAANVGSLGSAADATNMWGALAGQPDAGYGGFLGGKSTFLDGQNGYIAIKDAPGLHFSGNVTMMAWVKTGAKDYYRDIIARGWNTNYAETFLRVSMTDGGDGSGSTQNFYELGATDGTDGAYYDSALFEIPAGDVGNWVHLAGTFDGTWHLYRNGVEVATAAASTGDTGVKENFTGWTIGARNGPPSPTRFFGGGGTLTDVFYNQGLFFSGSIDEPAIFNTALSAADILAIYNSAQVKPVITRAPVIPPQTAANPGTLYSGSSASFNVWAEGGPTLGWLWLSNGVSTGITATNATLTNLRPGTPQISVVVTNAFGSTTSTVTPTVLATKPLVLQQPVAVTRYTGRPFSFSVVAGGSQPFAYQWKTNGTDIPGATSATYSGTASAAVALNYSCVTSNEFGTSNTVAVALTVLPIPTGLNGNSYAAAVFGDNPLAYWRLGESIGDTVAHDYYNGHDGTYLASALGQPGYVPPTLDPDTAVGFNGADSHVANINGNGATGGINFVGHTNFTIEAWVNGQPGQGDEATIIAKGIGSSGTTATEQFALDVSGGAYRFFGRLGGTYAATASSGPDGTWQHIVGVYDDLNVLGGGKNMYIYVNGVQEGSGATRGGSGVRNSTDPVNIGSKRLGNDPSYAGTFNGTVDEVAIYPYALSGAQVQEHYTDAYGTALKPTILINPTSTTNYETTSASFEVVAQGTQPLTYQWYKGVTPLSDNGIISGASARILSINPVASTDAGNYTVVVNNTVGPPVTSQIATFTVLPLPTGPVDVPGLVLHLKFDNSLADATGRGNNGTGMQVKTNAALANSGVTNTVAPSGGNVDFKYVTVNPGDGPPTGQALHYASYTTNGDATSVASATATVGGDVCTNSYFVSLGNRSDLRFSSNVNFSIAYWVRFPPFNGNGDLGDLPFFCTAINSYNNPGLTFAPNYNSGGNGTGQKGGGWSYFLGGSAANAGLYGPNFIIDDGAWHHLVHTYDRAGLGTTYLDGKKVDSRSINGLGNLDTGNTASIGQDPTGSYPESGAYDIDDVGVWRKALNNLEVTGIYLAATNANASFTGTYTPPGITLVNIGANKQQLTWPYGRLQSATSVAGPYSDVFVTNPVSLATIPATSPYTNTISGTRKFFRALD